MNDHRIVVGVDGSDGGRRALQWAVREVGIRGGVVQAVASWRWDTVEYSVADQISEVRERTERMLRDEIAAVAGHSAVTIAAEVVEGLAGDVLCRAAQDADLLVLGSHGHSRVRHTVLGSVSEECVRNAPCPVVVIPVPRQQPARAAEPATPTSRVG
jgi:nucleotide-binding universal stress UspA family protein